jgi:hypothetical protein
MAMRRAASIGSMVLGVLLIIGGAATWLMVSSTLDDQNITIPEDGCLDGSEVRGPLTAYCQAEVIEAHTLEITDGQTYAELDRDDPRRDTAMNASFLQASLFTSIVAFGVAAMAMGMGVIFILIGLGIRDVAEKAIATPPASGRAPVGRWPPRPSPPRAPKLRMAVAPAWWVTRAGRTPPA